MPQKHRSSTIKGQDVAAATYVVGSDLEVADFTNIQTAVDNLPAAGGTIFLLEGTYSISTTISLPDKPVKISGAGRDATIVDIGVNAIAAFTPGSDRQYQFSDFSIRGNGSFAQAAFLFAFPGILTNSSIIDNVQVGVTGGASGTILHIIEVGAFTIFDPSSPLIVHDCIFWSPTGDGASRLISGQAGTIHLERVIHKGWGGADAITLEAVDCILDASNGYDIALSHIFGCSFENASTSGSITGSGLNRYFGNRFYVPVSVLGNDIFVGNQFSAAGVTRHLDITAINQNHIVGNRFDFTFSLEAIRTTGFGGIYSDNTGCKVTEIASANANRYDNNEGFDGSTVIGAASLVDGQQTRQTTTTPYTVVVTDRTILIDATAGAKVVDLPTAASSKWRILTIKKIDASANVVTVDGNGAETIDGAATYVLTAQYEAVTVQSDGTTWWVI